MMNAGVGVVFGQQPKPGPGVQPWAVRPGAGGVFLPGVCRYQRGQRIDADRAGVGGHAPVGRDRQHIAQAVAADGRAQPRVGAIDFVAGHPRGGNLGRPRRGRSARRPVWVWSRNLVLSSGIPASSQRSRVVGPDLGKVQGAVDEGVPARCGVGQIHRDLGVLDAARRCRCTGVAPRRCAVPFFTSPVSSTTRIAPGSPKASMTYSRRSSRTRIGVPAGAGQQVLQPVGGGCAAVLGDGPAILAVQARDHARPSVRRHAVAVRSDEIAARSGRSPPRTPSATDQGLRYEPRRPRRIRLSSQTLNNAAVTAPTSADTPATAQSRSTAAVLADS